MSTAEVLEQALALPPDERASLAQSLLRSLPPGPAIYRTEAELVTELQRRQEKISSGKQSSYSAEETIRRAREAVSLVTRR
jgi:putative addiction module component (TIGR02574 family)